MVKELILKGLTAEALRVMQREAEAFPAEGLTDRVEQCRTEFRYMADFMLQGYSDARRGELYKELIQRVFDLWYDLRVRKEIMEMPYVKGLLKTLRSSDTSVENLQSMLLKADDAKAHHEHLSLAFLSLFTSYHWRKEQREEWQAFLTSPQTSSVDAATLVSAISLSCMQIFSKPKALCLAEVYRALYVPKESAEGSATSENAKNDAFADVRQRAFVGCILALCKAMATDKAEVEEVLDVLFQCPEAVKDLTEMQMQMATCANADRDSNEIRNKLMPQIIKNQPFKITPKGIVEREEEDDILDTDASERRMEQMEESMQRMIKMQKDGADVFFEGFSQMKRYPFFYKMANWFMPFYMVHPDIAAYISKLSSSEFVERVTRLGPFCNSDKYSFVIAMSGIMSQLPDNVREMMGSGEVGPLGMRSESDNMNDPSLVRLQYLQDLYRFYRLNPMATNLYNPYLETAQVKPWTLVAKRLGKAELAEMCSYLLKRGGEESIRSAVPRLLNAFEDKECFERTYCVAEYRMLRKEYAEAAESYSKCLKIKRNHKSSMRGIARAYYEAGEYDKAVFYFDALHTLYPDRKSFHLNYAMAMVKDGKAQDVINELYRLEFENPQDEAVRNILGWALLHAGKAEQALSLYRKFDVRKAETDFSVVLNYCYSLLFTPDGRNNIAEAVEMLRLCSSRITVEQGDTFPSMLLRAMDEDTDLLALYGFGDAEKAVIAAALGGME